MYLLFTKSKLFFSDLICSVTKEPISHVSIYDPEEQIVYHSSFKGVEKVPADKFLELQEKVIFYAMPNMLPERVEEKFDKYKHAWYDIGAMFFLGFSLLLRRYLRLPLPKSNLWQSTGMFLCTEWVSEVVDSKEDSLITPYQMYQELLLNDTAKQFETDKTRHWELSRIYKHSNN